MFKWISYQTSRNVLLRLTSFMSRNPITPFYHELNCTEVPESERINCLNRNKRLTSSRVYFILAIVNFAYIAGTTLLFVYRAKSVDEVGKKQDALQQIQRRPLRRRGVFGTVLGAIGHALFSTCMLEFQSFYLESSCDVLLWGTLIGMYTWIFALCWCSHRLLTLLRLSALKQRFIDRSKRRETDPSYIWFMKHRNFSAFTIGRTLPLYTFILIVLVTACAISEAMYTPDKRCRFAIGNYLLMGFLMLFFIAIIPILWWQLKRYKDLHGIRTEIMVQCILSVPCIVLYLVWIAVFQPLYSEEPSMARVMFAPGNWAVIMTSIGHILWVIIPLIKSFRKHPKHHLSDLQAENSIDSSLDGFLTDTASWCRRNARADLPRLPGTRAHYDLTADSLEQALRDPDSVRLLEELATKDFSVENILFYKEYLKFRRRVINSQSRNSAPGAMMPPFTSAIQLNSSSEMSLTSISIDHDEEQQMIRRYQQASRIPPEYMSACISLYQTFIPDSAPLQVNITAGARKSIEIFLEPAIADPQYRESNFSLEIFEKARTEVFWNIFTSVFPKFVNL
ncbi:hypothetical protein BJV82DRAFT_709958 [Fennellomyces sp. T-0311]|nr:hypothetical protein BJV82DRAFT_709958 [Fennellomyces sp. T-0311]